MGQIRILHVEDDLGVQNIFCNKLKGLPVAITSVTTVSEALNLIRQGEAIFNNENLARIKANPAFDIVVSDVDLADTVQPAHIWETRQDGYEVARQGVMLEIPHVVIASVTDTPSKRVEGAPMYDKSNGFEQVLSLVKTLVDGGGKIA